MCVLEHEFRNPWIFNLADLNAVLVGFGFADWILAVIFGDEELEEGDHEQLQTDLMSCNDLSCTILEGLEELLEFKFQGITGSSSNKLQQIVHYSLSRVDWIWIPFLQLEVIRTHKFEACE